ncbi:hypothetical protein IC582_010424 [Cucumis melo]
MKANLDFLPPIFDVRSVLFVFKWSSYYSLRFSIPVVETYFCFVTVAFRRYLQNGSYPLSDDFVDWLPQMCVSTQNNPFSPSFH